MSRAPIHTVTLNPALDQTVMLDHLDPGEVVRASAVRLDPGGKGVNVASCLADWGADVVAHGLLGQDNAALFEALFARKKIRDAMIRLPGATRTNIKILETGATQRGRTTDVNLPGFAATTEAGLAVARGLQDALAGGAGSSPAEGGALVVISGSQPAGLAPGFCAALTADLAAKGARVVLDVSGAPLTAALAAPPGALPHAIKPNRQELEAATGQSLPDREALLQAATGLVARGIGLVVISQGTEGALFVSAEGAVQALPVALSEGSTVGAGDAMVAGITAALQDGLGLADLARLATGFAAGKLRNPGPHLPPADEVRALAAATQIIALTPASTRSADDTGN